MKQYQITVDGRTFDIQVLSDPRQAQVEVAVDGERLTLAVNATPVEEEIDVAAPSLAAPSIAAPQPVAPSSNVVTAPLPGVVKLKPASISS